VIFGSRAMIAEILNSAVIARDISLGSNQPCLMAILLSGRTNIATFRAQLNARQARSSKASINMELDRVTAP
jgi:hypothetical protein